MTAGTRSTGQGAGGGVLIQDSSAGPTALCALLATTGRRAQRWEGTAGWITGTKPRIITPTQDKTVLKIRFSDQTPGFLRAPPGAATRGADGSTAAINHAFT